LGHKATNYVGAVTNPQTSICRMPTGQVSNGGMLLLIRDLKNWGVSFISSQNGTMTFRVTTLSEKSLLVTLSKTTL
jgi:hypothetical protein